MKRFLMIFLVFFTVASAGAGPVTEYTNVTSGNMTDGQFLIGYDPAVSLDSAMTRMTLSELAQYYIQQIGTINATITAARTFQGPVAVEGGFKFIAATAFSANDATPSIANYTVFQTANTVATTITNLDDGQAGDFRMIVVQDSFTTWDFTGTNLSGNAGVDYIANNGDLLIAYCIDGTAWHISVVGGTGGGGGAGEINTAANAGLDGVGVFYQKSGVQLQFRHIAPGSTAVTVTLNGNDIDIDVVPGQIDHDALANFVANEHIDWTQDQGGTDINLNNIPDLSSLYEPLLVNEAGLYAALSDVTRFYQPGDVIRVAASDTLPGTCTVGDLYLDIDADTNGTCYICIAPNTWKDIDDDGQAGSGDLLAANNLSDVASVLTSFNNIKQAATMTYSGVIELADQTEAESGTAVDRAITPLGVEQYMQAKNYYQFAQGTAGGWWSFWEGSANGDHSWIILAPDALSDYRGFRLPDQGFAAGELIRIGTPATVSIDVNNDSVAETIQVYPLEPVAYGTTANTPAEGNHTHAGMVTETGNQTLTNKVFDTGSNTFHRNTASYATSQTLTAVQCYGSVIYMTGAGTVSLPPVADGMEVTVITAAGVAVSVDPDAADLVSLDGTALADGNRITNTSTAGDVVVLTYFSSAGWYASTNGWTDGGP